MSARAIAYYLACVLAVIIVASIILTAILMTWGYLRAFAYMNKYSVARFPKKNLSDVYFDLKTGDLLLFVATVHGFSNSIVSQQIFSHTGLIVEIDGKLFISEATMGSELMPRDGELEIVLKKDKSSEIHLQGGVSLTPLLTRLKYYSGHIFLAALNAKLDETRAEKIRVGARKKYPYPTMTQMVKNVLGFADGHTALLSACGVAARRGRLDSGQWHI